MFGKPVIKGTRITVEQILRKLAGGMDINEIISDHPHLRPEDIFAAQEFAADHLAEDLLEKAVTSCIHLFELSMTVEG